MGRFCLGFAAFALLVATGSPLFAAPPPFDAAKAEEPLRVRADPEAQALLTRAKNLYAVATEAIKLYQDKRSRPAEFAALMPIKIGETSQSIVQLRRTSEWLMLWGEAAGTDYLRRSNKLEQELLTIIAAYKAVPGKDLFFVQAKPKLQQLIDKHKANIPAMARMMQQKKAEDAEAKLYETFDELEIILVFYDKTTREDAMLPFVPARDAILPPAQKLRTDKALASLTAARAKYEVNFAALPGAISAACTSLQATGQATIDGKTMTGPEALKHFARQWQQTLLATTRYRALSWEMGLRERQNPPKDLDQFLEGYQSFARPMPKSLSLIVESDAARVSPEAARELYLQYVAAVAEVCELAAGDELTQTLESALGKLASRSPQLEKEIATYRKLTREVLRWRRLATDTLERSKTAAYVPFDEKLLAACKPAPPFAGLVLPNAGNLGELRLNACVPDALEHAHPLLAGQQVIVGDWAKVGAGIATRYRNRTLCTSAWPPEIAAEVVRLKADLFVTDEAPAMTLEAAAAVYSAERGYVLRVGGQTTELALEPLATYFAVAPDSAAGLLALGPLPDEPASSMVPAEQVLLRVTLEPEWIRHDYFFWQAPKK